MNGIRTHWGYIHCAGARSGNPSTGSKESDKVQVFLTVKFQGEGGGFLLGATIFFAAPENKRGHPQQKWQKLYVLSHNDVFKDE
jgi:hypothetical protein